jgi:hypothetical protein
VLSVGPTSTFSISGVPTGVYYVRAVATSATGSSAPSNEITVIVQ